MRLPQQLQRAMAAEAEAAREARAKVIAAEGEHQASRSLANAAEVITQTPAALQVSPLSARIAPFILTALPDPIFKGCRENEWTIFARFIKNAKSNARMRYRAQATRAHSRPTQPRRSISIDSSQRKYNLYRLSVHRVLH